MLTKEQAVFYCIGLLEGEGYFGVSSDYQLSIQCLMTDVDPLKILLETFGGHLSDEQIQEGNRKCIYRWTLYKRVLVIDTCTIVYPFMSERRKIQIDKIFEVNQRFPIRVAKHGTRSMYTGGKCRCTDCRQAQHDYMQAYR